MYFSFRHNYLNYGNIGRASSTWTKQKKLANNEKQAIRIIDSEYYDIREKMSEINILNIHKINIYQVLNFMFTIKSKTAPSVCQANFSKNHASSISWSPCPYPARFNENSSVKNQIVLNLTKFAISSRDPHLRNKILN